MRLRPNSIASRVIVSLSLIWFVLVILAYFAVHKPIDGSQVEALRGILTTAGGWISTVALANLLGWAVMRRLSGFRSPDRLVLQVGLGFGLIAFAMLALGLIGAYSKPLAWLLVLLPLPISLYRLRQDVSVLRRPSAGWLATFVIFVVILVTIRALLPPTAWDSLVYHLTGPKLYQEAGRIHHDIDLAYLGFPKAGSMLFLLGVQLSGPRLAQLFHATFFVMTVVLIRGLVREAAPGRGWLAAAIMVAVPSAALLAGWAYVEWITAFGVLASFSLIQVSDSDRVDRALILAAFFAALALNTKYTAVWIALGLSLVVVLRSRSLWRGLAFLLATIAFVAPFLITNLLLTRNPVYPFIFDGLYWDGHRAFWYSRPGSGLELPELVTAPWDASIWGLEGGFYEGHAAYGATIGPLLLALIPLVFLRLLLDRSARQGSVRDLVVVAGFAYVGWLIQLSFSSLLIQSRLLFPVLPFLVALAAIGFDTVGQLGRWGLSVRFVLGGLVAFILALTATSMLISTTQVFRAGPFDGYLTNRLGYHFEAMQGINELEGQPRVRFLWEPRSYYCNDEVICEPDALLDRWWHDRQHYTTVEQIRHSWVEQGVTHVLFHRVGAEAVQTEGFDPLDDTDWKALDRFLEEAMVPLRIFGDAYVLYEILP